jgi:YfiH family protein
MADSSADLTPVSRNLKCEAWAPFTWLVHGFTTRTGGVTTAYAAASERELNLGFTAEDERPNVEVNRQALLRNLKAEQMELVTIRQVHSKEVHCVAAGQNPCTQTGDGLITNQPGLLLAILTADCVPVLIIDRERKSVGAFHAGWRGTRQRIVEEGVARMEAVFKSRVDDLSAVIGPCIGPCCYVVGDEVRAEFTAEFKYAASLFNQVSRGDDNPPAQYLDLVEANRRQLLTAGLGVENIYTLNRCTSCEPETFFSYRKSGGRTGRMMSVIGVRELRNQ